MTNTQATRRTSTDQILRVAEQLPETELGQLVTRILAIWAQRLTPPLTKVEKRLLGRVKGGLPARLRRRYDDLAQRRDNESLTPEEYRELLRLTDTIEGLQVERLAALNELARRRKLSVSPMTGELAILLPAHE